VLDHVFLDAIGALRNAFEGALLERQAVEERFQADILLGDVTWETSYSLPGEGRPPRVKAEVTLDWPTWSQTAYRSWCIGEATDEHPEIDVAILLRVQRLKSVPDAAAVMEVLPENIPGFGDDDMQRSGPVVEQRFNLQMEPSHAALEVGYEATYHLDEETLRDGSTLDRKFGALGGWISSTLVRLGDLKLEFLPPLHDEG
jgi:hypothetical protein